LIVPQVKVQPVYLPAVAFLVESSDGYFASLYARFLQARRHSQGVIELGYVLLQYARLVRSVGFTALPARTHAAIMSIAVKMHTLHITSTAQCFALIMAALTTFVPKIVGWIYAGGIYYAFQDLPGFAKEILASWWGLDTAQQALAASIGNISGVVLLYSFTCWLVICDLMEGRYHQNMPRSTANPAPARDTLASVVECNEEEEKTGPSDTLVSEDPPKSMVTPSFVTGPQSLLWRLGLLSQIFNDTALVGYGAITFFAMIPVLMAGWSLFRRGTDFEYIVAMKPE